MALQPFPTGFYSIAMYLTVATANCTSNPVTWRCFPYTTYDQSAPMSLVTFFWNITHHAGNDTFAISSSNPFSINFVNVPLTLLDRDTDNERYYFSLSLTQAIIPSSSISQDNVMATCDFESTLVMGNLYTRRNATSQSVSAPKNATRDWKQWQHAVEISQQVGGGGNIPTCYRTINGVRGDRVVSGLQPKTNSDMCQCSYQNFDL